MQWIRTSERNPPEKTHVLTWSTGQDGWGHGFLEDGWWYYGCECFTNTEGPEFWALVDLPVNGDGNA